MKLIKPKWNNKNLEDFYIYQKKLKGSALNCSWEKRIVNTKLECYARTSTKARIAANQISKGDYLSFLDVVKIKTHFDSLVCAHLISKIEDFNDFSKYLKRYVVTIDNWASCDTLRFKKQKHEDLFKLSKQLIKSNKEFIKRTGINVYFDLISEEKYIYEAFKIFDSCKNEKHYYVNMVCAWLLSFIYIKYPKQTLVYFKNNKTNSFIINKGISKCRDSYRLDKKQKDQLLKYKIK